MFEEFFAINSAIGAIGAIADSKFHERKMSIMRKKTPVEFGGVYVGPPESSESPNIDSPRKIVKSTKNISPRRKSHASVFSYEILEQPISTESYNEEFKIMPNLQQRVKSNESSMEKVGSDDGGGVYLGPPSISSDRGYVLVLEIQEPIFGEN